MREDATDEAVTRRIFLERPSLPPATAKTLDSLGTDFMALAIRDRWSKEAGPFLTAAAAN